MEELEVLVRHGAPGKLDHAPTHTRCKVQLTKDTYELYIQQSLKEDNPVWELVDTFESASEEI
jgi:hypothetical protein